MSRYAKDTTVSAERSRAEIETILVRYGATGFMYAWQGREAAIQFVIANRMVRFVLPLPDPDSPEFSRTQSGRPRRDSAAVVKAWEQSCRQSWRALVLAIKAKLEAVESGISTFEQEFLSHIVLPNGNTVGQWLLPQLNRAYETNTMPPLLPGPGGGK